MKTKISNMVEFNGLKIPVLQFIQLWVTLGQRKIENMPFKKDLRYWNDGPTAMLPKKCIALYQYDRFDDVYNCIGVYEVWERQDGFYTDVYLFKTLEDYNNYNPSDESPAAFKNEIGVR